MSGDGGLFLQTPAIYSFDGRDVMHDNLWWVAEILDYLRIIHIITIVIKRVVITKSNLLLFFAV